jgi:HlyD family secretion protein
MKAFLAKQYLVIGVIIVFAAGGAIFWYITSNEAPSFPSVAVARGNVISSVSDPATVRAENSVSLSFQEAGRITQVNVKEGDTVAAGQAVAMLDESSLKADLDEKSAALAAAQATLDELMTGTRPERLQIDESAAASASTSLAVAAANAYTAADDAIRNQTDNLFSNPETNNPTLAFPTKDSQAQINIQTERVAIGAALDAWYAAQNATTSDSKLAQIKSYLDDLALLVNDATANSVLSATTLAGYKADVVTARTEVGGAITALTAAETAFTNAENELQLAQAGTTPQAIEAQKAAVLQAQAAVTSAQVALDHAVLTAPFPGTVQDLTATVGQVVASGAQIAMLINNSGLKIETYVSEADVAKIKPGDAASVTLSAYGVGTAFPATVTTIDPGETEVNGAPAYKVTLHFTAPDARLKDGMTGNVSIVAAEHDNVIVVPSRLVISNGNNYFILVQRGNATEQQQVGIGLTGANGMTEITSGLNVGDQVVNF